MSEQRGARYTRVGRAQLATTKQAFLLRHDSLDVNPDSFYPSTSRAYFLRWLLFGGARYSVRSGKTLGVPCVSMVQAQ